MSVYTDLSANDVTAYLKQFSLGEYHSHQGISAGVENTNFFVFIKTADKVLQKYVLTIFEHHNASEVEGFINIGRHLAEQNIPVPAPIADTFGQYLYVLKNKPAILCVCLPGSHPLNISSDHCWQIGKALAQFHIAGTGLKGLEENNRGLQWWPEVGRELIQHSLANMANGSDLLLSQEQQEILSLIHI